MILNKKHGFYYFSLFFIIILLSACAKNSVEEENQENEITGEAITEILRACKYSSNKFCEERCCQTEEKCEDGSSAYIECDLKEGEWVDKTYSDSTCASECEIAMHTEEKEYSEENITLQSCHEGWKCLNKFEKIYRNSDCSFGEVERCSAGCVNDTCAKLCTPSAFSCKNEILRKCDEDGNNWAYYMSCDYGCEKEQCLNSTAQTNQTTNNTEDGPESEQNVCSTECFSIISFHYDADGNDNNNLNDEYVTMKNGCQFSCDLTGWEVSDAASHKYNFQNFILGSENEFTLYSGDGINTNSQLFWNRGQAVWNNNDGDTLYLKNQHGELIFSYSYS